MTDEPTAGDRIAKVMARAGVASRRDAERLIVEGRVAVNGKTVTSPALDVLPTDRVTLDGKPIDAPQAARLWLYYKPLGLVTSEKDEKGRQTVFESLPDGMPRVMSIGRLDLNSEGLLLLTNDGALKRRLELPSTGWLRKYRVRVNGRPNDATFDPLRRGVIIDGEEFQPMEIVLDRQQGANAWLTVGLREGKNREIRRAMTEVGLIVNRLIRVSYGPFRLNKMEPGEVVEVKQKVLKDQLGESGDSEGETRPRRTALPDRSDGDRKPRPPRAEGASFERKPRTPRAASEGYDRKPRAPRSEGGSYDRKPRDAESASGSYDRKPRAPRAEGGSYDRKPHAPRAEGEGYYRKPRAPRAEGSSYDRKPRAAEGAGGSYDRKPRAPRAEGEGYDRKPRAPRSEGGSFERKPRAAEGAGGSYDRKPRAPRDEGEGYGRKPRVPRAEVGSYDRKPRAAEGAAGGYDRKPRPPRAEGSTYDRKPRSTNSGAGADRKPRAPYGAGKPSDKGPRPARGAESGERKPYAPRPKGDGPSGKPRGPRPGNPKGPGRK